MIEIYNSLTKRKEVFRSIKENEVGMYVCGPTTYNYFHIGNGRAFLFFDVVRNYFRYLGMKVTYVQNITDIEDKIIDQAKRDNLPIKTIAAKYTKAFFEDIKGLEISKASRYPKATEYITQMIDFIGLLVEKGHAYVVPSADTPSKGSKKVGDVFFSVKSLKEYGELSGKKIEEQLAGARVDQNRRKKFAGDFVLWKTAKEGEPYWNSPWGKGRPGWHTECVVMSNDIFQGTFDIHCGGVDLVFPHHENEIAQAKAATAKPLANYWMHNGFVNIEGEKMSKSLRNFLTVRDILKSYSPETIRHFYLSKHYRSPIDFNEDALKNSQAAVKTLYRPFQETGLTGLRELSGKKVLEEYRSEFEKTMNDDFNTAKAIAVLFDIVKAYNSSTGKESRAEILQTLKKLGNPLGFFQELPLKLSGEQGSELSSNLIELLINYRDGFKKDKNYQQADQIREDLKKLGITLQDTPEGTKWIRE